MAGRSAFTRRRTATAGWPLRPDGDRPLPAEHEPAPARAGMAGARPDRIRAAAAGSRAADRSLPAHPAVEMLLPGRGLRRGSTVAVTGSMSLLFAVLGPAMRDGQWAAIVGRPDVGAVAAAEHDGLDLARLVLVPFPGPDWPRVVAALVDGLDLVAVNPPSTPAADVARSLSARARQHGTVLLPLRPGWPGLDLHLHATSRTWTGLDRGWGRLRHQELEVTVTGRGAAARPTTARLPMPLPPPVPDRHSLDTVHEPDTPSSVIAGPWRATA